MRKGINESESQDGLTRVNVARWQGSTSPDWQERGRSLLKTLAVLLRTEYRFRMWSSLGILGYDDQDCALSVSTFPGVWWDGLLH